MNALKSNYGKLGAGLLVVAAAVILYLELHAGASVANDANTRPFVDIATGQPFKHELVAGEHVPIMTPSGQNTGYPAELCYWTADGKSSDTPTSVVLNAAIGKPGPTFCPVCHRLVVGHNPQPMPGIPAPPTEAEWHAAHPGSANKAAAIDSRDTRQ